MGLMNFKTIAAAVFASALTAGSAFAATVSCPGSVSTADREFTVTSEPATTCIASGRGNINGNTDAGNPSGLDPFLVAFPDYLAIDKSDSTLVGIPGYTGLFGDIGPGGLSGSITLVFPTIAQTTLGMEYYDFAIGFKTGEGQLDPDWAIFGLPAGLASLTWSISGKQALSHTMLYAKLRVSEVPLPASLPLLLGGIGLLGFAGRRRKATTA